jgi:hypothetical protein
LTRLKIARRKILFIGFLVAALFASLDNVSERSPANTRNNPSGQTLGFAVNDENGARLREAGQLVKDSLLTHLSPLGWEHINLTGDYVWHANKRVAKGGFRPLRKAQDSLSHLFTVQSEA